MNDSYEAVIGLEGSRSTSDTVKSVLRLHDKIRKYSEFKFLPRLSRHAGSPARAQ